VGSNERSAPGANSSSLLTSRFGHEPGRTLKVEIRKSLEKYGLEPTEELIDRAYTYVAEHY
jgi:hypothetical protein